MDREDVLSPQAGEGTGIRGRVKVYLDHILHSSRANIYLASILILIASIPRFFYISRDIKPNGVDEGVQIMAGRMMHVGYEIYTQINTVQAPLMLLIYGIVEGDPVIFRIFSTLASLIIMGCVMWVGRRIGGRHVMVASGAFVAMDLMFLHESRLASLDMFCLLWISLSVAFFIKYRQSGKRWALLLMGMTIAIGSMIKLFAVIAAGTMGIIMFLDWINDTDIGPFKNWKTENYLPDRKFKNVRFNHMLILLLSFMIVILTIMARFGYMTTIEGMFLNQLNRPKSPLSIKLQFFGVFLLLNSIAIPFFFFGIRKLYRKTEGVILLITAVFFIYFMTQATTWIHHFVFLSPGLALTSGMGVIRVGELIGNYRGKKKGSSRRETFRSVERKIVYLQVILLILVAVVGGGFSLVVKERGQSARYKAASLLEDITESDDYVISGDPLIPVIARRSQPPGVVNLAELKYPAITSNELNSTALIYGVEVVIITYHLGDMEGFVSFVETHYRLKASYSDNSLPLMKDREVVKIYYLPGSSVLRDHRLWGLEQHPSLTDK